MPDSGAIGLAQVAEVADPRALLVDGRLRHGAGERRDLEREGRRRRQRIRRHADGAGANLRQQGLLVVGPQTGLLAEREGGADLDAGCARGPGLRETMGLGVAAGEPERQAQTTDL